MIQRRVLGSAELGIGGDLLPSFDGALVVEMPPDWRSAEPVDYTFCFTKEDLSAAETRAYIRTLVRSGASNPRLFTPRATGLASLFHPTFWHAVAKGRNTTPIPQRLLAAELIHPPRIEVSSGRYFLQSLLFLTGVTLSAAVVQDRWSSGTIESKLSRLWQAGAIAEALELRGLHELDLQEKVRQMAEFAAEPDYRGFLKIKGVFARALEAVTSGIEAQPVRLTPQDLDGVRRDRFGFLDELRALLGDNLQAVIAYGSSVTSDTFADYDLILVAREPLAALTLLAGRKPRYRGVELNLSIFGPSEFWTYQLASGDNLSHHALALYGEIEVPEKEEPDLLARNYSFGFIRLRQLLGMAAFASRQTLHTNEDDKRNLYGYFVKIPFNVAKGTRGAVGRPIDKTQIQSWIRRELDYDVELMLAWCGKGRAGDAIATAAWCTQEVMELLNAEHPSYRFARAEERSCVA